MDPPQRNLAADQGESGKENALPHLRGFAFGNDELALVRKAKAYEERIAAYDGPDPIGPRYEYIAWLETHYPAKDKKKGLLYDEVFKLCRLVDSAPYNSPECLNDQRYVDVWLLYATLSHEPLKMYDFMKTKGIGARSAMFYTDWAFELERIGKYSKAQATYKLGFDNLAEPRDDLEAAFNAFVARRSTCQDEDVEPSEAERQVLQKLRPVGRQRLMAPVQRIGSNVLGPAGTVPSGQVAGGSSSNARWDVRADEEENADPNDAPPAEPQESGAEGDVRFEELMRVEENRTEKIAFGSKVKVPGRRVGPKVPLTALKDHAAPAFSIFCEETEPPRIAIDFKVPQAIRTGSGEDEAHSTHSQPSHDRDTAVHDDKNVRMICSGNVSAEERLAAAKKYMKATGESQLEARCRFAQATSFEVGFWVWRTTPTLTAEDLPKNTKMQVPDEVFEELSLEEVLLKRRRLKGLKRKSPEASSRTEEEPAETPDESLPEQKQPCVDIVPCEPFPPSTDCSASVAELRTPRRLQEENLQIIPTGASDADSNVKPKCLLNAAFIERFLKNPFSEEFQNEILAKLGPKGTGNACFYVFDEKLPRIQLKEKFSAKNGDVYVVDKIVGEGSYAKVFRAIVSRNNDRRSLDQTFIPMQNEVVFKVQKPPCPWESYICNEIHKRLSASADYNIRKAIVKVSKTYMFKDGSLLVSNFEAWGSLLCAVNFYKRLSRTMPEALVFCYAYDILQIVQSVHECSVIHADLKVDNFLISDVPNVDKNGETEKEVFGAEGRCLQLIDFGRSIDLSVLPPGSSFTYVSSLDEFKIPRMREGLPWNYHVDHFGIAATVHVLLFGKHMEIQKNGGRWYPVGASFRRPLQGDFWKEFFDALLNLPADGSLPSLTELRGKLFQCFMASGKHLEVEKYASELKGMLTA